MTNSFEIFFFKNCQKKSTLILFDVWGQGCETPGQSWRRIQESKQEKWQLGGISISTWIILSAPWSSFHYVGKKFNVETICDIFKVFKIRRNMVFANWPQKSSAPAISSFLTFSKFFTLMSGRWLHIDFCQVVILQYFGCYIKINEGFKDWRQSIVLAWKKNFENCP